MKMPLLNKIYGLDEKVYYIYMPGTTHYDEDKFGNPRYVYDYEYLDENFNRFVMQTTKDHAEEVADKLRKTGRDVIVGPHTPEKEDKNGDYVPYSDSRIAGIWERPTKEQLDTYTEIVKRDIKEIELKKQLA